MPIKIPLYQFETSTAIERHGRAQRTQGTTDPGGVWHPVHRKECLTILLGTYAENDKSIATDDERIVFSTACLCLHWQPPILSFSGYGTIALERRGALFHCTLLEILSRMYCEN